MAGTGASTVIIGRQLNHKSPAATALYSRHQLDPVREARNYQGQLDQYNANRQMLLSALVC